ncbi:unnamed protein product [Rotaria socialis]|uniref:Uncharacterized protein n=2 Tax=Rotaria socialis TaxID=392032 RepID=A0A818KGK3_9BILA|nr:unnamed protein product [Rotaria socialis]
MLFTVASILHQRDQFSESRYLCNGLVREVTLNYQLYQSDLPSGNITVVQGSTSRVGRIQYRPQFYIGYNQTCDRCQVNRYLICQNTKCQCPRLATYWDGQMCQNQLSYMYKLGVTAILFDGIPNLNRVQSVVTSVYNNISWTHAQYLNATAPASTDYQYICSSNQVVFRFNVRMTIQTSIANTTFAINSFVIGAGWPNSITVTIVGYLTATQTYTTTVAINTNTKQIMELH